MLTIGIPTYNDAIAPLVANVWEQCAALDISYEIIVVDDASSNTNIQIDNKQSLERAHCRFIQHTENKGRTASRARIAEEAQYDWLLFFDADVIPQHPHLIKEYLTAATDNVDALFGGIVYEDQLPDPTEILRWTYGRVREQVNAEVRNNTPYVSVVSACFMMRKSVFMTTNPKDHQGYGLDIRFAKNLANVKAKVRHIDQPVFHLGLEANEQFLQKTMDGVATLAALTKNDQIPADYKALQRFYLKLKRFGLLGGFLFVMNNRSNSIHKNLTSNKPSLFWFDMFRAYEYAKQMKHV